MLGEMDKITRITNKVWQLWKRHPNLKFCELLSVVLLSSDYGDTADVDLEGSLDSALEYGLPRGRDV